jgi:hypothetical protein
MSEETRHLYLRHLEQARQELGATVDSMDSMGDMGRFLPDLRRVVDHLESEIAAVRLELGF